MPENNRGGWLRSLGLVGVPGTLLAFPIVLGTVLGIKAGEWLGGRALGAVLGFLAGLAAGGLAAYRLIRRNV